MSQGTVTSRPPAADSSAGASRRSVLTLADQVVASASNFAVAVVVAHLAGVGRSRDLLHRVRRVAVRREPAPFTDHRSHGHRA